jgi:hypothetical protein
MQTSKTLFSIFLATLLLLPLSPSASADPFFARLSANLDEERGYCFDLSGFDDSINWDRRLQAHTCKQNRSHGDQVIESSRISAEGGALYMPVYDICLEARAASPGSDLLLKHCDGNAMQQWQHNSNGQLQLVNNPEVCITVGSDSFEAATPAGFQQYWYRSLFVDFCEAEHTDRQQWHMEAPRSYNPGPGARMP